MRNHLLCSLLLCAAAAAAAAVTATSASPVAAQSVTPPPPPVTPGGIEQARIDSIRRPYTAADVEFMTGMISHHAQAVKMASWAESHGASKGLQIFAGRIALGQTAEIGLMQAWLGDRRQPVPDADPNGMKMKMADMGGMEHTMLMPGMLTEEQMKQLDAARGVEFDRLFLLYMIQHHQGAISMVDKLLASDGAAQDEVVFKFSNDVQADQTTEIDRMKQMIDALPAPKKSKKSTPLAEY